MDEKTKRTVKTVMKIIVTVVLLTFLLMMLDLRSIWNVMISANMWMLALTIPLTAVMYMIRAEKWRRLLKCIDVNITCIQALVFYMIGTFYGTLTPGRVGEISRAFYLKDKKFSTLPTIIIDRVIDITCLILLSTIFIITIFSNSSLVILLILVSIMLVVGIIITMNERVISALFNMLKIEQESSIEYVTAVKKLINSSRSLMINFIFTLIGYAINMLIFYMIILALNPSLNSMITFSLPILIVMANVPISISGLGVRESVSVIIFTLFNESPAYGFSTSLLLYAFTVLLPSITGSMFLLRKKPSHGGDTPRVENPVEKA